MKDILFIEERESGKIINWKYEFILNIEEGEMTVEEREILSDREKKGDGED